MTKDEELAKYMLDFEAYDLVKVLRGGPQETEHLPALVDLTKTKLRKQLTSLEKANIVTRINDEDGRQHVILKCNPEVMTVYPEWLIQRTIDLYNDEEIVSRQAMHYLEVLKKSHPTHASAMAMEVE